MTGSCIFILLISLNASAQTNRYNYGSQPPPPNQNQRVNPEKQQRYGGSHPPPVKQAPVSGNVTDNFPDKSPPPASASPEKETKENSIMEKDKPSSANILDMAAVRIDGVDKLITGFSTAATGTEWSLTAFVKSGPKKIFLADLTWTYKPDDGTFEIDTSNPITAKVILKNKDNIWADPKLQMKTKDYIFHAGFTSKEGGSSASIDSVSLLQCSYPVEFYTANRKIFNFPPGYEYKLYIQKSDGTYVKYKDYQEYGFLEVDLVKGFKERIIFTWNEETAGKKTRIKLDIYKDGEKVISQSQQLTSDCGKSTGGADLIYYSQTGKRLKDSRNPKFSWSRFEYLYDSSTDAFFVTLPDFRIRNNVTKAILQLRKYYVELRLYHKNYPKDGDFSGVKEYEKNILKIKTRIYPYHITGHKIFLDHEMDGVKKMGYTLEKEEAGTWFDGYFRVAVVLNDEDEWYDLQVSSPYYARFRYRPQTIFSKAGYEIELKK